MTTPQMIRVQWPGTSGHSYAFQTYPIPVRLDPVSGVYVICKPNGDGSWTALYVGEAQSLYDRLNAGVQGHDGFKRALALGATHISVMRADAAERMRIETELRHSLRPLGNAQPVPARPRGLGVFAWSQS